MKRLFAFDRCEEARRENGDAELDGQETVPQLYAQQRLTKVVKGQRMGIRQSGQNIAFPNPNGRLGPALRSLLKRCEASGTSVACVAGVNGKGEGERERRRKMGFQELGTRERLPQRPPFFHLRPPIFR